MIIWKLLLLIVGALETVIGVLNSLDLFLNGKNFSFEDYEKFKVIYYSLIGVGIGMLVGGIML